MRCPLVPEGCVSIEDAFSCSRKVQVMATRAAGGDGADCMVMVVRFQVSLIILMILIGATIGLRIDRIDLVGAAMRIDAA